jgi:fructose-bisphosphate aldolase class I
VAGWDAAEGPDFNVGPGPAEKGHSVNAEQLDKVRNGKGFLAALDQSGGSTPKALRQYGIEESEYSGDEEMFGLIHQMRSRIITSKVFNGDRVLGAILFEKTMDGSIEGQGTAEYLWERKQIVPFLKVDKGLADERDGVQVMKPIPGLRELCERAVGHGVFGTKMRSVIKQADKAGIEAIVAQQFEFGAEILQTGLVPILEPEVDIHCPNKAEAEELLRAGIVRELDNLGADQQVMLKLTIPTEDGFYSDLIADSRILRVVALSGGYSRQEADEKLTRNPGLIASFSRALLDGLTAQQSQDEFDKTLDEAITEIYQASLT